MTKELVKFIESISPEDRFLNTSFLFQGVDCRYNRDGLDGSVRMDTHKRSWGSPNCHKQVLKMGVAFGANTGLIVEPALLLGCKGIECHPKSLKESQNRIINAIAKTLNKKPEDVTPEDVFEHTFDIPVYGMVNAEKRDERTKGFSFDSTKGVDVAYYHTATVTKIDLKSCGISNAFGQEGKNMSGSHQEEYVEEAVYIEQSGFNLYQLRLIAKNSYGITNEAKIEKRIKELIKISIIGLWTGYQMLGNYSSSRRGIQPLALYAGVRRTMPTMVTNPADILWNGKSYPAHKNIPDTIKMFKPAFHKWLEVFKEDDSVMNLVKSTPVWDKDTETSTVSVFPAEVPKAVEPVVEASSLGL